jgi:hypothetical protein
MYDENQNKCIILHFELIYILSNDTSVSFSTMSLYIKQIIKTYYVDVISILFVGETTRLTSEIVIQNLGNHALDRYILIYIFFSFLCTLHDLYN